MVNNFTHINNMNNHLSSQIIEHKKEQQHMTMEIQGLGQDRNKNVAGLNNLMGPQSWVSSHKSNAYKS